LPAEHWVESSQLRRHSPVALSHKYGAQSRGLPSFGRELVPSGEHDAPAGTHVEPLHW